MPMEKGFWKPIDPSKLVGDERARWVEYKEAVDRKLTPDQRGAARKAFIESLTPRLKMNGKLPAGMETTVMYNRKGLSIGFKKEKKDTAFFDLGAPLEAALEATVSRNAAATRIGASKPQPIRRSSWIKKRA
jgi:hypothetical protein